MKQDIYFPFLLLFLLGGCTQLLEKSPETDQIMLWLAHQSAVNQIDIWRINGRVGIKADKNNGSASLRWHQLGPNYEIHIIASLGQGSYIVRGSPENVVMQGPDDALLTAEKPQQLMNDVLGWPVHIEGMQYWIKGIPEPETDYQQLSLDNKGRLAFLNQSGFSIEVQRYVEVKKIALPKKLTIKNDNLQLKVIIKNWEI